MSDFVHLHLHSEYSLLDGACRIEELLDKAVELKMPAMAITEHGNMFSAVVFHDAARKRGINPILGCEVYVAPGDRRDKSGTPGETANHLVLLAENETGFKNLIKLVSAGYTDGFYYKPRIDKELLAQHAKGLIGLSSCLKGEVAEGLSHAQDRKAVEAAAAYRDILGPNNFFLEMQWHGIEEQRIVNSGLPAIARDLQLDTVVADLDLGFGTAGLDFNQDPPQGIADAVFSPERIDTNFIDRLLSKCTDHLSLLAAPATLDRIYDLSSESFDSIFDALRATMPFVVLDVPHQWSGWTRRTLMAADHVLIVAMPDLANLRNAKNLLDLLKASRPNDRRPFYLLNNVGVPKRPEISNADFAKALDDQPVAIIPFEPQLFGAAANNGQMIAELSASHRTAESFRQLAQLMTGRPETKKSKPSLFSPFLGKLLKRA